VPPSWFDRAISSYYEKTSDEPIVAIIRQDAPAQIGAISPDGQYIATGGNRIIYLRISSLAEKRIIRKLSLYAGNVTAVTYSPDGRYLATGRGSMAYIHHNESVHVWDAQSGRLIRKVPGPKGPLMISNSVTAMAFSPDSRILAVSYMPPQPSGESLHLIEVATGKRVFTFTHSRVASGHLTFSLDGMYLGYEDLEGSFIVHDVSTGKRLHHFTSPGIYALSPDGQYLATRSNTEQRLKIIERQSGREVKVLDTTKRHYRSLHYSPDGRYLAVNSDDGLAIWDVSSGKIVRQPKTHPDIMANWIGFDAEGKYFAAVCNQYIIVWDFKKLISAKYGN
jgi:WD40 repeat protein